MISFVNLLYFCYHFFSKLKFFIYKVIGDGGGIPASALKNAPLALNLLEKAAANLIFNFFKN